MRTVRIVCFCAVTAAGAMGQAAQAPSLASLEATAQQKTAEWMKLSDGLSTAIGHLLPCDPKVAASIAEVSTASEARLSALAAYLQAAGQQVEADAAKAKQAAGAPTTLGSDLAAEKPEVAQEQMAIDGQLSNLDESLKKLPALSTAQTSLKEIQADVQRRGDSLQTASVQQNMTQVSLSDMASAAQARADAWKDLLAAYEAERARWNGYYAARVTRAQVECTITKGVGGGGAARRPQGKQQ